MTDVRRARRSGQKTGNSLVWLASLRTAFDDADAVTQDMLRPLRERRLGPAEWRRLHREATEKIDALLANPQIPEEPTQL